MSNKYFIPITQYIRPDGRTKTVQAPVTQEHKAWVEEHQPVLSAEIISATNQVVLYGRLKEWHEDSEITLLANNHSGPFSPSKILYNLINKLMEAQDAKSKD